ncbi:MAG: FtsX-like permease family protein [Simkaniaceae bacterium]|nr:FtsX-like permease family protein [Simkaniaceae bacterium]
MFPFAVAKKYLIPKRKQLSASIIALISVVVISLVVWLVLLFLSVTTGIEKGWLDRLTSLHSPIRVTPTQEYFHSYYHMIDSISSESGYTLKSFKEKLESTQTDPYDPECDAEIPAYFPEPVTNADGSVKDLVQEFQASVNAVQHKHKSLMTNPYEVSGALLRLKLLRETPGYQGEENQNFLTQMTYIASYAEKNPHLNKLLLKANEEDLSHLFYLAARTPVHAIVDEHTPTALTTKDRLVRNIEIALQSALLEEVSTVKPGYRLPPQIIPLHQPFKVNVHEGYLSLPTKGGEQTAARTEKGWKLLDGTKLPIDYPLVLEKPQTFKANIDFPSLYKANSISDLLLEVHGQIQDLDLSGMLPLRDISITKARGSLPTLVQKTSDVPLLVPRNYRDSGVKQGDRGYLAYGGISSGSAQEHRLSIVVAGFYDPGVLSVGAKCLLMPYDVVRTIASASNTHSLDPQMTGGFQVWCNDTGKVETIRTELQQEFEKRGLSPYFKITTFREYDFAKDLLQQFQSDKNLFTLIGIIILIVACSNIISFLVLLVNDKKKEIGILMTMGASRKQIGWIFAICGFTLGILGCLLGTGAAILTLKNIDSVVAFLSHIQGHAAFNTAFYGSSLPNELSRSGVAIIAVSSLVISLIAAYVPARKASRLNPSQLVRSES